MDQPRLFVHTGEFNSVQLNNGGRPIEVWAKYAEAFRRTARLVAVQSAAISPSGRRTEALLCPDEYVVPCVYNFRHAVELNIKCAHKHATMLRAVAVGGEQVSATPNTHRLLGLWNAIKEAVSIALPGQLAALSLLPSGRTVESTLAELERFDLDSFAFRYPDDTKGAAALPRFFSFDLIIFCDGMDELFQHLTHVRDGLGAARTCN